MATSLASVVTTERRLESAVQRTGVFVEHRFSVLKIFCWAFA